MAKQTKAAKLTTTELAKILGLTQGRISQLVKDRHLSEPLELHKSVVEYISYKDSLVKATDDEDRIKKAKADLLEAEVERLRIETIPLYLAQAACDNLCNVIRKTIDAVPNTLAPKLVNIDSIPEAKDILQRGMDAILRELVNPDLYNTAKVIIDEENKRRAKHTSK